MQVIFDVVQTQIMLLLRKRIDRFIQNQSMMKGLAKFESCYKPTKCANVTNADLTTSRDGLNNPHLMCVMIMTMS